MSTLTNRTVRLAFATGREPATGPLTWSQQHMLALIEALHPATASLNPRFVFALRPGLSEPDVLDALQGAVTAFDALRTLYVPPPEGPAQRVVPSGEIAIHIVEVGAPPSESAVADAARAITDVPFDITRELPVRVGLLCSDGRPWRLALAFSHLAIDLTAVRWLRYHLRALLAHPPAEVPGPVRLGTLLDRVWWESSPAGRRAGERALRQHEATLRAIPQTMLPRPAAEPGPARFRYLEYDSPALAIAVPALATRHRVTPTAVLYAGICAVTGYVSGLDRPFLQLTVGNRVGPRDRFIAGMLTQDVPAYVDLAGAAMPDVIAQADRAIMTAVRFGQYPHDEMALRRHDIEIERGIALDLSCWLNDRRDTRPRASTAGRPDPRTLANAIEFSRWRWTAVDERSTSTYFIFADDEGDALRLTMLLDTTVLPPDEAVAWLRAVERLLCATTSTDVGISEIGEHVDLAPTQRGDGWCLVDAGWVHLPTAADLVRRTAGARHAEVFAIPEPADGGTAAGSAPAVRPGGSGARRLVAFLDGGHTVDIARLHAGCVGALPGLRTTTAPQQYIVCAGSPSRPGLAGWRQLPVLTEGTGRTGSPLARPGMARRIGDAS
jgi:hypothetical protein